MAATMLRVLFHLPEVDDFPGPFARRARQVAAALRDMWDRTSREAATNRRLPDLHAARDDYHALLKGHLRLLEDYLALTELHRRAFGSNPTWVAELRGAVNDLKALYDELFPRWQTAEDLQQILVEQFSVPADKLRELAAKSPPPAVVGGRNRRPVLRRLRAAMERLNVGDSLLQPEGLGQRSPGHRPG